MFDTVTGDFRFVQRDRVWDVGEGASAHYATLVYVLFVDSPTKGRLKFNVLAELHAPEASEEEGDGASVLAAVKFYLADHHASDDKYNRLIGAQCAMRTVGGVGAIMRDLLRRHPRISFCWMGASRNGTEGLEEGRVANARYRLYLLWVSAQQDLMPQFELYVLKTYNSTLLLHRRSLLSTAQVATILQNTYPGMREWLIGHFD